MTRARELSQLGNTNIINVDSSYNIGIGSATPDAKLDVVGILSAVSFSGSGANLSGIAAGATLSAGSGDQRVVVTSKTSGAMDTAATDADLSWNSTTNTLNAPTLSGNITGTAATFSGDVSVGGVLTHEDVTNIDSVGVVTARSGIKVGAGESISAVSGTLTYYGDGSNLDGIESGVVNYVASGTLANGIPVILKDDGTVGIVTLTGPSAGTVTTFEAANSQWISVAYVGSSKVVIAYADSGNSGHGTAVVGTVSGTDITFGTPVVFESALIEFSSTVYDPDNDKVVISYQDTGNSNYGTSIVGTVSGTSISFGSHVVFESDNCRSMSSVYDTSNNKIVLAYRDQANYAYKGTAIIGTVSGTSISFGTAVVFEDASTDDISVAYIGGGKVVMAYRDSGNSGYGTGIVGTVSGTSISFGTAAVFTSSSVYQCCAAFDISNSKVVIGYSDGGNSYKGTAVVGTVSGTSISFGTPVLFPSTGTSYNMSATYYPVDGKPIIVYTDYAAAYHGIAIVGTVSGTSISFDSKFTFNPVSSDYCAATYDSTNEKVVMAFRGSSIGKSVVFNPSLETNLTTDNYIGITGEAIANAATGKVNVVSGTNTGQSGLTIAQTYYVSPTTGILTTTAGSPSVVAGTSISDTEILVWKS